MSAAAGGLGGGALAKRLALAPVTMFSVALVVFVLLRIIPGDPISLMAPPGATASDLMALRHSYGLDKPIPAQFVAWLGELVHGDLGRSISFGSDVVQLVLERLPATLELVSTALLLALAAGGTLALAGSYFRGGAIEWLVDGFIALFQSIPDFLLALLLILVLNVMFPILPGSGRIDPRLQVTFATHFYILESIVTGQFSVLGGLLAHMILPAVALALPFSSMIARVLKVSLGDAEKQDYTAMARTRGFTESRILLVERLPNAVIPAASLTGIQLTFLLAGTVLVERIFAFPGLGNLAVDAVQSRDLPLLQAIILAFALLFIVVNLASDLIVMNLNPRLKNG